METEEYRQLEEQLKTAASYQDRHAIRCRMRELKRESFPGRVPAAGNDETAVQKTDSDSLLRPKSTIVTNGHNNSSPQLENGVRKSYTAVSNSKDIKTSKTSNSILNPAPTDHSNSTKLNGDSNDLKKRIRFNGEALTSRTPPVSRKEPLKTNESDTSEPRRRAKTLDSIDIGPDAITIQQLSKQQIQQCLTEYINRELRPIKKIIPTGESLYLVSADPRILCRLINVSKRNTVDMRCLTDISDNATDADIKIAVEENMTLAVESARSIGCHIAEADVVKIIHHDADIIHKILLKILQARVIDFKGMDEQPSWYFTEPSFLFEKLNIPIPEDPANGTTTTDTAASSTASLPASSPPAYQKLTPTTATTNNIKKHSAQEVYRKMSKEETGSKIRRVRSDAPPEVMEKIENKHLTKAGVKGLTASFENKHPTTGPKTTGIQLRIDPAQNEIRREPPDTSNRLHKNAALTKSNDFISNVDVEPVEEKVKPVVSSPPAIETQSLPTTTRKLSSEKIPSPYTSPKKTSFKPIESTSYNTYSLDRSYRKKKSESLDDLLLDSAPSLGTYSPPSVRSEVEPQKEVDPISLATVEIPPKITSSPNSSSSTTDTVTPLESNDQTFKDTDEYLLTLDERDPSLTYEQRKQIRRIKRLRKQAESKK